jgi:hypothetical protein
LPKEQTNTVDPNRPEHDMFVQSYNENKVSALMSTFAHDIIRK